MALSLPFSQVGNSNVSFVSSSLISVPNTQVVNRAQIRDLANDMGARMGIERIPTQFAALVPNEFGPNGEQVQKPYNDDRDLIRFVGNWVNLTDNSGQRITPNSTGDFVEVTFYGTGLNVMIIAYSGVGDLRATVDGGSEGGNLVTSYTNNIISRSYDSNQIIPVVSGLSPGVHTVKLRVVTATPNIYGFEILNESSTIRVNPGTLIKDQRQVSLASAQSLSASPAALTGIKGGRVVIYNNGGQVAQAVQAVDTLAQSLSFGGTGYGGGTANHSNEEIVKVWNFREFGNGRTDDFSRLPSGGTNDAYYTAEDGTTTLVAHNVFAPSNSNNLSFSGTSSYMVFTFVGTGLDIIKNDLSAGSSNAAGLQVLIDGVTIGNLSSAGTGFPTQLKVVSGLPYGTHTVRLNQTSANAFDNRINAFVVYQPKKPSVPSGAAELADYNVLANFDSSTITTDNHERMCAGVLAKMGAVREAVYVGSGWTTTANVGVGTVGWGNVTSTNSDYCEYTFCGTGVVVVVNTGSGCTASILIDGVANASGVNVINVTNNGSGNYTFGPSSNNPGQDAVKFTGLTYGKHTIRVTRTGGAAGLQIEHFDVITPIHAPRANLWSDLQNSLPIGSCGLSDSRQLVPYTSNNNKFVSVAIGIVSSPTTTSTTYVALPDMSLTVPSLRGGWFNLQFSVSAQLSTLQEIFLAIFVDGVQVGPDCVITSSDQAIMSQQRPIYLPIGVHKVDLMWRVATGTGTAVGARRTMSIEEQ